MRAPDRQLREYLWKNLLNRVSEKADPKTPDTPKDSKSVSLTDPFTLRVRGFGPSGRGCLVWVSF